MDDPAGGTPASEAGEAGSARVRAWIAGGLLPADTRIPDRDVAEVFGELLALAETLDELPLDGVEPLLGPPGWS
jgi:hypothetical protein